MSYYGYERMTEGTTLVTDAAITLAQQRSSQNNQAAWKTMKTTNPQGYQLRKFRADYLNMLKHKLILAAA